MIKLEYMGQQCSCLLLCLYSLMPSELCLPVTPVNRSVALNDHRCVHGLYKILLLVTLFFSIVWRYESIRAIYK